MNLRFLLVVTISVARQVAEGQELPPVFVEEPIDVSVREGEDVLLHCKLTRNGSRCQWTRGREVIEIRKGSMYQYASDKERGYCSLRINRTSRQDENLWSCQLPTPLGTFTSRTAQISFIVPPEAPIIRFMGEDLRNEQPITVLQSSEVHFECISRKGKPASTLEFILKSPLNNVQKFIQQSADDPHLQDSIIIWNTRIWFKPAEYLILCIAHHPGYNHSLTTKANITVQVPSTGQPIPPLLIDHPTSVTVREGDAVLLDCKIRGNASGCQWTRGGQLMNFTQDPLYQHTNGGSTGKCSLRISQTTRADETLWSCRIPTPTGQIISKSAQISFIVPPDPPIIRFQNQDLLEKQMIEVNQSEPFLLECLSRKGKPASFLEWTVNINQTSVQRFNRSNSEDPRLQDSILIWNTLGWSKPGKYLVQCTSHHSGYHLPYTANVTLNVARNIDGAANANQEQGILTCMGNGIHRQEQNFCQDKNLSEKHLGSKVDFVTTIAITVPVTTVTIIVIIIGIRIKRRRTNTTATETEFQKAHFPTYLTVLPDISKKDLYNRPQLPLPRGSQNPVLQDDGSDYDGMYETIDDPIIPCGTSFTVHQVSPLTESIELHCYETSSLETIADESEYVDTKIRNEQTPP